jgi:hypothetical protein
MNTKKKNLQYYNLAGTEEDDGKDGISMWSRNGLDWIHIKWRRRRRRQSSGDMRLPEKHCLLVPADGHVIKGSGMSVRAVVSWRLMAWIRKTVYVWTHSVDRRISFVTEDYGTDQIEFIHFISSSSSTWGQLLSLLRTGANIYIWSIRQMLPVRFNVRENVFSKRILWYFEFLIWYVCARVLYFTTLWVSGLCSVEWWNH